MVKLLKNCMLSNGKKVDILIINETIAKISEEPITQETCDVEIDATFDIKNNLVMPGIIDGFSRIKTGSPYDDADFSSESIACAYGGITTFVDVPVDPITDDYFKDLPVDCNAEGEFHTGEFYPAGGNDLSYTAGDHRFVWPIPSAEIESNPQMEGQQNDGY